MAHNFENNDNMFLTRTPSWHKLEQTLFEDYPTREEAQAASLPWEVATETLYRMVPVITDSGNLVETYEPIEDFKMTLRDDTHEVLGVVSSTYGTVKNSDLFDIMEGLEKASRGGQPVRYETGGSLKGGKKVFLLARLEEPLTIKGDPFGATIPYYGIQNSHDGSGALRGQALQTRIQCDNTARAADLESQARGTEFVFKHTASIQDRIADASQALIGWRESITYWQEMMEHLINVPVTEENRRDFIDLFIPMPVSDKLISDRVKNNINTARGELAGLFQTEGLEAVANTAYGLVQGAIEWSQHYRPTKGKSELDRAENKFKRAYLDNSDLNKVAVKLVKELVNA